MTTDPVFLVDSVPPAGVFLLNGPEGRHAARVRRMRTGERLELTDGRGRHACAVVIGIGRDDVSLDVGPLVVEPEAAPRVVLVQALPKGDRGELAVELATEAGVDVVVPWEASRCVARWSDAARAGRGRARWQAAAREAAKQSRRFVVPEVLAAASTNDVAELVRDAATSLVLHESAASSLASTALAATGDLLLIVGPEGGISADELATFDAAGAIAVRLGPQVLRTSTAAAVALGALGVLTGRWGTDSDR